MFDDLRRTVVVLSEPLRRNGTRIHILLEDITSVEQGLRVYLHGLRDEPLSDITLRLGFLRFEFEQVYFHAGHSEAETEAFLEAFDNHAADLLHEEELVRVYRAVGWAAGPGGIV